MEINSKDSPSLSSRVVLIQGQTSVYDVCTHLCLSVGIYLLTRSRKNVMSM